MRVVLLSRTTKVLSTKRLAVAARARGHQVRVIDPTSVQLQLGGGKSRLLRAWKRLQTPELVVPRFSVSVAPYALSLMQQFVAQGAVVLNDEGALGVSRNPVRCLQRLSSAGLRIPRTVLAKDAKALKGLVPRVGGLPVVVKLVAVSEVPRVMLCESMQTLESAVEAVLGLGHDVMMQESVRAGQRELRVMVVGGKVVAAVERVMRRGRASRNLSLLEKLVRAEPSPAVRALAEAAATTCGLEVCAVDIREGKRVLVTDVQATPNLTEFEEVCEVDLASAVIAHGEALVRARSFPKSREVKEGSS